MRMSIASPLMQPSPNGRRVGIRIVTFEACSGFTRVTARRIAQPPKVTFVTRLRSHQLPSETARQLPDLSTIIRVEPSSTDDSRLQGALPPTDSCSAAKTARRSAQHSAPKCWRASAAKRYRQRVCHRAWKIRRRLWGYPRIPTNRASILQVCGDGRERDGTLRVIRDGL